jgi:hypothetical protein
MRVSPITLTVTPGSSPDTRTLNVSYQVTFSAPEVAANQVVVETVSVQPDPGWVASYEQYLSTYGYGTLIVSNLRTVAPLGAIVANDPTVDREVSWEIAANLLDVFHVVGPYSEEEVGVLDSLIAHVDLKPYSPPAPIGADSNVVQSEWG